MASLEDACIHTYMLWTSALSILSSCGILCVAIIRKPAIVYQLCRVTLHGKILVGEKLANLVNHELFAKIFLINIHRYTENVYGICTDRSLSAKFFLANSFYQYGSPIFSPAKYLPYTVHAKFMVCTTQEFIVAIQQNSYYFVCKQQLCITMSRGWRQSGF